YEITDHGPEHDKTFRAVVFLDGEPFGTGFGRSKKLAEQAAAREAWHRLGPRSGLEPAREESDG
ncbi:MAG: putative dsRNA-binding protein, partial [Aquihabitans sp.]